MCNNTLARTRNVIDNVHVNNVFLIEIVYILKAIKSHLKGRMINRILHLLSFHTEFIKKKKYYILKKPHGETLM